VTVALHIGKSLKSLGGCEGKRRQLPDFMGSLLGPKVTRTVVECRPGTVNEHCRDCVLVDSADVDAITSTTCE
jgi:hypothetical protein